MADIFSSFAGACQLLEQITKLSKWAVSVHDAPAEMAHLDLTLTHLKCVTDTGLNGIQHEDLQFLNIPFETFRTDLSAIHQRLKTLAASKSGRVRWATTKDVEFTRAVARLEQYKSTFSLALSGNITAAVREVQTLMQQIQISSTEIQAKFEGNRHHQEHMLQTITNQNEESKERFSKKEIEAWLSPLNFASDQNDLYDRHLDGTGQWMLKHPEFLEWLDGTGTSPVLWCVGIPGAGKSVLSSIIIHHLQQHYQKPDTAVVFLYCRYKMKKHSAKNLLSSILRQLVHQEDGIPADIDAFYHIRKDKTHPSLTDYAQLVGNAVTRFRRVFLVVDALDECSEEGEARHKLMTELGRLPAISLLITSRPIADIEAYVDGGRRIEVRARDEDVRLYIESRLSGSPRLSRFLTNGLREEITDIVLNKAQGMFLLVNLQMDILATKLNPAFIRKALRELPKTLEGTYDLTLTRITEQDEERRTTAIQLLSWVTRAARPLTASEIQHALAVCPDDTKFDSDFLTDESTLISICAGLVTIDGESKIVRLVHYTLNEYFKKYENKLVGRYFTGAEGYLARTCIAYLLFDPCAHGPFEDYEQMQEQEKQMPFLNYAAKEWGNHSRKALVANESIPILDELLALESNLQFALQAASGEEYPRNHSPLHIVSSFGLRESVAKMEQRGFSLTMRDSCARSPIWYAVRNGHEPVVRFILTNGANIHEQDMYGDGLLQVAAEHGYEAIIQLLLEHGIEVDTNTGTLGTALQGAAYGGHTGIVRLLVEKGANVNSQGGFTPQDAQDRGEFAGLRTRRMIALLGRLGEFGSALYKAATRGHEAIVHHLLESGADIDCQGGTLGTPLQGAVSGGHDAVVRLLLSKGADPNAEGGAFGPALTRAAAKGYDGLVQLLLESGSNVNSPSSVYGSALQGAVFHGRLGVVHLLLAHSADINATGGRYDSLFEDVVPRNVEEEDIFDDDGLLRYLLRGQLVTFWVSKEVENDYDGTALHIASFCGPIEIVQLLIDHGADVNRPGGSLGNPLQHAARNGRGDVVRVLLALGAEINRQGGFHGTALQAAAHYGHTELVQELLDHGAEILHGPPNTRACGPLQAAAARGRDAVLRVLLDNVPRGSIDIPTGLYGTPLNAATVHGNESTVRLLLDRGANVNGKGGHYSDRLVRVEDPPGVESFPKAQFHLKRLASVESVNHSSEDTALQIAAYCEYDALIHLLLDRGADMTLCGDKFQHLIHRAAASGQRKIVKLLLDRAVPVDLVDKRNGFTALFYACYRSHESVVELLLARGADTTYYPNGIQPILHTAAAFGQHRIVERLLDQGVPVDLLDPTHGNSALYFACQKGNMSVVQLLLDRGADIALHGCGSTHVFHIAAQNNHDEIVELFLSRGVPVDLIDPKQGLTALYMSCYFGYESTARLLLTHGADIMLHPQGAKHMFHVSADTGQYKIVRLLLDWGVPIDLFDQLEGVTALYIACYKGHESTAQLLLDRGADVHQTEWSPYIAALQNNHQHIAQLIQDRYPGIMNQNQIRSAMAALQRL